MSDYKPVTRIIRILEKLSAGQRVTTTMLYREFDEQITLRTIQRDLLAIQQAGIPLYCDKNEKKENVWSFSREYRNMLPPSIQKNELLSLYALKSFLKEFRGTHIEAQIEGIIDKLENIAPGEVYMELQGAENFVWDQDYGQFDYSSYDLILNQVLDVILAKKWIKVTYKSDNKNKDKSFTVFPYYLFGFHGVLYLAAYMADYKDTISMTIQKITSIEIAEVPPGDIPAFDIDAFRSKRFGVFSGEPREIKLKIDKTFSYYFINRSWHNSQEVVRQKNGDLLLKMTVPLSPELLNWILGWQNAIKVKAPDELIEMIKESLLKTLNYYHKS